MPDYLGTLLKNDITIGKLYTVHYFEYSSRFKFTGESHDFWELVYIDKGDVTVTSEDKEILLTQGNMIFHKPNEWHNIQANGTTAANSVIITFSCNSPAMSFFENKILKVGQSQRTVISKIITEYTNAFKTPLDNPYTTHLERKDNILIGSEQLIKQYISEILISFLRTDISERQRPTINVNLSNTAVALIVNYMQTHINKNITLSELVKYSGFNKTYLENAFNESLGCGVLKYFINLKVDLAKKYLRENNYNVTQISQLLGYSSVHYFSRQFKKIVGMSPIEYSNSVKAMQP